MTLPSWGSTAANRRGSARHLASGARLAESGFPGFLGVARRLISGWASPTPHCDVLFRTCIPKPVGKQWLVCRRLAASVYLQRLLPRGEFDDLTGLRDCVILHSGFPVVLAAGESWFWASADF